MQYSCSSKQRARSAQLGSARFSSAQLGSPRVSSGPDDTGPDHGDGVAESRVSKWTN